MPFLQIHDLYHVKSYSEKKGNFSDHTWEQEPQVSSMMVAPGGQVRADLKNIDDNNLEVRALKLLTLLNSFYKIKKEYLLIINAFLLSKLKL